MSITFNSVSQSIDVVRNNSNLDLIESIYQNANGEWMAQLTSNTEKIDCDSIPVKLKNFDECILNILNNAYQENTNV